MKYYTLNGFVTCNSKELKFTRELDEGIMIQIDDEPMELARPTENNTNYEMYMHEWAPWCIPRKDDFADIQDLKHPKSEPQSDLAKMLHHIIVPGEYTFKLGKISIVGTFEYREDLGTRVLRLNGADDKCMACDIILPSKKCDDFIITAEDGDMGEVIPKNATKEQFTSLLFKDNYSQPLPRIMCKKNINQNAGAATGFTNFGGMQFKFSDN